MNTPSMSLLGSNMATAFQGLKLYEKAIDAYQFALAIDEKAGYCLSQYG